MRWPGLRLLDEFAHRALARGFTVADAAAEIDQVTRFAATEHRLEQEKRLTPDDGERDDTGTGLDYAIVHRAYPPEY